MFAAPLIALYGCVAIVLAWEWVKPAHPTRRSLGWIGRAAVINGINIGVFLAVGGFWARLGSHASVFKLDGQIPALAGALLAYFIFTFVVYWWHRARHAFDFLWRWFHQIHHSPHRIELLTAYYIHPLDMLANLCISSAIVYALLGLSFEAASWYTFITGLAGFLIHANIRLPRLVGYVFQTPEMHRLHHKYNHHASNYSDIVWWDMLFGTYENPEHDVKRCGFDPDKEARWLNMLCGKDVHGPS
jgi:sterol desaturase/sphingolipid hydroxylase (fatty acid hydroxylase superfamily)